MRQFKFIGNPNDYNDLEDKSAYVLKKNEILQEDEMPPHWENDVLWHVQMIPEDWEEVTNKDKENTSDFEEKVTIVLDNLKELLINKNKKYGNSALNPIRVFSKASNIEQIKVRLDDKLSRLRTQHIEEDEDVLNDLIGYLVLLKIASK